MSTAAPPTDRQLRYLRTLAVRAATTFATPATRSEASREIDRLIALARAAPSAPEHPDDRDPCDQAYATAVRADEVSGFGSSARWRSNPPAGGERGDAGRPPKPAVLLRYRVSGGERVVVGEPVGERLLISDVPAKGRGTRYEVQQLETSEGSGPLSALIEDYRARALELDDIPMAGGALAQMLAGVCANG